MYRDSYPTGVAGVLERVVSSVVVRRISVVALNVQSQRQSGLGTCGTSNAGTGIGVVRGRGIIDTVESIAIVEVRVGEPREVFGRALVFTE